ncbi:MAG: phosphatase PAP2 family protein [bacterium]|nr:phosphatase PAP2 family protein [bacterium]
MLNQASLDSFFYFITQFGGFFIVGLACFLVILFLWWRNSDLIKYFIIAVASNEVLVYFFKKIIDKPRPFGAVVYGEHGGSMPSGHAAISILLYGYVCYLIVKFYPKTEWRSLLGSLLLVLILLIGFSRLYLNVHYFSDVIAGYLLGGSTLFYLVRISERKGRK